MTDTENTLIPVAVTLEEVLASRERRAARQAEVLAECGFPLISVTIVQPGTIKDSADTRFLMTEAQRAIVQELRDKQYPVLWQCRKDYVTGPEALYCIQTSVQQVKTLCVELEDRHPLGRLWDLDVIDIDGIPVSRTTTGHMPRRCLVCSEDAHICARARTHSSENLSEEISRRINAFNLTSHTVMAKYASLSDPGEKDNVDIWANMLRVRIYDAMMEEVLLTPKPGLVDRRNSGAHRDMNKETFKRSAVAICAHMPIFFRAGYDLGYRSPQQVLPELRTLGIACEQAMFQATSGVNTHKGAIFAFGLVCAAAGRLFARSQRIDVIGLSEEVAALCQGLVERELASDDQMLTAGERIYHKYGFTGARGEAESGFRLVLELSLPTYLTYRQAGWSNQSSLLQALLLLMSCNNDTNIVSRGGLEGLEYVKDAAQDILFKGGCKHPDSVQWLIDMDDMLISKNLSPGGSADLLALTWFFAHLPLQAPEVVSSL